MTSKRAEPGPRMSQAIVHGDTVYLAGQVGAGSDVQAQSRDAFAFVERLLAEVGSDKSRILSATVWLADVADLARMNSVWEARVDLANPPASVCGEARLAMPD